MPILEGSRAIALTVKNIDPNVVSAYPITPQTHIVEDLAKFKADGDADYEYIRAESEFAAASIVEGASARGVRTYSATSAQGILLMNEVLYNIAGMRLPVVITCANRGLSAPITIWNDHQDAMAIRDAGWVQFFAENHQEAVWQHILAYKIAESLSIPAVVNIDGFVLTHSYEGVRIPDKKEIDKFLPAYKPAKNAVLDPEAPVTMGAFAPPAHYMEIREDLQKDLLKAEEKVKEEWSRLDSLFEIKSDNKRSNIDNGILEYYGPTKPKTILVAMGSVAGTLKDAVDEKRNVGLIKLKLYRPFPRLEILRTLGKLNPANIAVVEKAITLGHIGPLASDIKSITQNPVPNLKLSRFHPNINSFVAGLGGRDINKERIDDIIKKASNKSNEAIFIK